MRRCGSPFFLFAGLAVGLLACSRPPAGDHDEASTRSREPALLRVALLPTGPGCYALFDRDGQPIGGPRYPQAQSRIRLDSAMIVTPDSAPLIAERLAVGIDSAGIDTPVAERGWGFTWAIDSLTDSLRLSLGGGLDGTSIVLAGAPAPGDTVWGRAERFSDLGPPESMGPVMAVRIPCGLPGRAPDARAP